MLPTFLLEEQVVRQDSAGPVVDLGENAPTLLNVTLGITRIIEQESLDLSIWASADGSNWGDRPVFLFPQKFYCGVYTILVDLAARPGARYLRAQWKVSRWGRGQPTPLFEFYLFAKAVEMPLSMMAATA